MIETEPMLVHLSVANLVLIESLSLEFGPGFSVLTGETGAGKSMLIDALGLVLGGRAKPESVRAGAKEAEVEALFELGRGARALSTLADFGIEYDGELVVRRVVQAEGRSRAFVNGRLVTLAQLAQLGQDLCDIASQHESVSLTDPATHIRYLDAFGALDSSREAVELAVENLLQIVNEMDELVAKERNRSEREDFLRYQVKEIDELAPRPGEEAELEQERGRLRFAERLTEATRRAADRLYEGEGAICDELGRLASDLEHAAEVDGSLAPLVRTIEAARAELSDAARALARYADGVESNPARLGELEERLFKLQKLLRKYGPTTVELLAHRESTLRELEGLEGATDRIAALEKQKASQLAALSQQVRLLSKGRREAAERLADAIGKELAQLGMGRARVLVDVAPVPSQGESGLTVDGAKLTRQGIDRVEFLIAPNRGEDPKPLRKIASGGELSRALLALKRVLADRGPAGLYVFDEVDAGVSGAIAEVIGHAIADIGKHRQVLCITHLPQIAALASAHFVVGKAERGGRTFTEVRALGAKERVEEIARMLGGVRVSDTTRKAAAEMLRPA